MSDGVNDKPEAPARPFKGPAHAQPNLRLDPVERDLLRAATLALADVPGVRVLAREAPRVGVVAFTIDGVHPHDIGTIVDLHGVAIRAGHHCAQPLMDRFGIPATARASFAFYNTRDEVVVLVQGLMDVLQVFGSGR